MFAKGHKSLDAGKIWNESDMQPLSWKYVYFSLHSNALYISVPRFMYVQKKKSCTR
jgi:hypothetical protein